MSLTYPNIVPENNLRLPDALTIKHGPAELLARFVLEGDKEARRVGLRLRLRHDFDNLRRLNEYEVGRGNWFRLVNLFNPEYCDLTPENSYWLSGENEDGEIVATVAWRIFFWPDTNLLQEGRFLFYGRGKGRPCEFSPEAARVAAMVSGVVSFAGSLWVRPGLSRASAIATASQARPSLRARSLAGGLVHCFYRTDPRREGRARGVRIQACSTKHFFSGRTVRPSGQRAALPFRE